MRKKREDLTPEVREKVVRDYLAGEKAIVILMEYEISPGEMYRILHRAKLKLRRDNRPIQEKPAPEMIFPQLPAGNGFRVAMWDLTLETWDWNSNDAFEKLGKVLVEFLEKEPLATVEALGFRDTAFKPEDLIKGALALLIEYTLSASPNYEHLTDDTYRMR